MLLFVLLFLAQVHCWSTQTRFRSLYVHGFRVPEAAKTEKEATRYCVVWRMLHLYSRSGQLFHAIIKLLLLVLRLAVLFRPDQLVHLTLSRASSSVTLNLCTSFLTTNMNVFCGLPLLLLSHSCIFSILWPVYPLSLPCLPTVAQFPPLTCCCKPGLKPIQCGNVILYDPHCPLFYTLTGTTLSIYPGLGLALGVHSLVCSKASIERSRTRHYIKLEKDAL